MRTLRLAAILTMAVFVSCIATVSHPYYLTATPKTIRAAHADSVIVHIDDRTQVWLDGLLLLGRKEQLEQAACLRVAKVERGEIYVDSVISAAVIPGMTTIAQIVYSCGHDQVPYHAHIVFQRDGWDQCIPSAVDMSPGWAKYPALMMQCGVGTDSIVTWRAKR